MQCYGYFSNVYDFVISNLIEQRLWIFMDDVSIYGDSPDDCFGDEQKAAVPDSELETS